MLREPADTMVLYPHTIHPLKHMTEKEGDQSVGSLESPGCTAVLELAYGSNEDANLIDGSTRQDNDGFVETEVCKNIIRVKISANNTPSLVHTLDDYLECLTLAENIITRQDIKKERGKWQRR
jgi:hypothetical protein